MRNFLLPLLLLASAPVTAFAGDVPKKSSRPNVVILLADDMGWGDLGVQNPQSKIPTPNLDALARAGMRFTDGHSSSGICTPSRYALLHGRYHWRKFHGIVNSFDQPVLDAQRTTLAQLLRSRGYRTACIGKWHLGWDWNAIRKAGVQAKGKDFTPDAFDWAKSIPGGPLSHGFDYYFGDDVPNFPPYAWFENDRVITPPTVPLKLTGKPAEGAWEARPGPSVKDWDFHAVMPKLTAKAVEWIGKQKAEEPFFLYFPFTSPHAPIVPSADFVGKSKANGFGDFMTQTDDTVGQVLAALVKHGFAENTIVIFTSDNGPEHYAYERVRQFQHRSMGPLRGVKRDLWEGGHRVPFLVRWPGVVPAGKVEDGLISHIDFYATLAAITGTPIPADSAEDSINQLPLWKAVRPSARETVVHNTNANSYALRHGDWLLIAAKSGAVTKVPDWFDKANGYSPNPSPGELYNLREDLGQKKNLYADNQKIIDDLTRRLSAIQAKGQSR
jgi:arylsulfatase A